MVPRCRPRRAIPRLVTVAAVALAASGCIGAQNREEFQTLIQARGGGVSNADIAAIVDRLEEASGADPLVRSARFNFGASTAVLEVRSRERPTEVDRYTFRGHTLVDTTPVRIDVDDDLEATSRPLSTFALDEVERIADEALAEFNASGGYVTGLSLIVPQQTIRVDVESPRATGTGVFDAEGDFQEFQR